MFALIVIGERGNLSARVARARAPSVVRVINQMQPHMLAELAIFGFDDDPRELWNVEEARDYIITFFEEMKKRKVPLDRILPQSLATLRACYAARDGQPVVSTGTVEDTVHQAVEQVMQYRRSKLH